MRKLTIILLSLIFASLSLSAQEVKEVGDTIDSDQYLPITRQQAEELITKIIIEARKPHIKARQTERMLREFKLEAFKRRLLDQALRDTYMDEYKERMDRLERLLITLIMAQSGDKADPAIIQNIITQGGSTQAPTAPISPIIIGSKKDSETVEKSPKSIDKLVTELISTAKEKSYISEDFKTTDENEEAESFTIPQAIEIKDEVYFAVGSYTLSDIAKSTLDQVITQAIVDPSVKLQLKGYASPEGNMVLNNRLSEKRVNSVATYLKEKGFSDSRLVLVPSGVDSMKAQKREARRVEITTVK